MRSKFPNLPSDELAMLATVEAASNAEQLTVFDEVPKYRDQRIRLAACWALVTKGWILGTLTGGENVFWSEKAKVFKDEVESYQTRR
jgi:hypothetical protein